MEYPKTENLWLRDEATHKLIPGAFRNPAFDQIKTWHVTEKIDGTNMRVLYDPLLQHVSIRGRSDRANVAGDLRDTMLAEFTVAKLSAQFDDFIGAERIAQGASVTLFGEGYGPGIQKGGYYGPAKAFRLFDVMYHWPILGSETDMDGQDRPCTIGFQNSWCQPSTVEMIGASLGCGKVPLIGAAMGLDEIVNYVRNQFSVALDSDETYVPEGVVARTDPYLYTERGSRVMFKLKGADL